MSNHSSSYMLNEILKLPELQSVFQDIGIEQTQSIILKILNISNRYDCNSGEILDGIGEQLKICYCCTQTANKFIDCVCQSCYDTYFEPTYATDAEISELISLILKTNDLEEINQKLQKSSLDVRFISNETKISLYKNKLCGRTLVVKKQNNQWVVDYNDLLIQEYNAIISSLKS